MESMNTQAKARVELDMLMFKLEAVEKMMREMQISVNSIKQSINPSYVESYHCITSGDK
jgi:hypothetical protein